MVNETLKIIGCILAIICVHVFSHKLYNSLQCNSFIMITNQLCYGLIYIMYLINVFMYAAIIQIIIKIQHILNVNYQI